MSKEGRERRKVKRKQLDCNTRDKILSPIYEKYSAREKIDKKLAAFSSAAFIGFMTIFSIVKFESRITRWLMLMSFILLSLNTLFILWTVYRNLTRLKMMDSMVNGVIKSQHDILDIILDSFLLPAVFYNNKGKDKKKNRENLQLSLNPNADRIGNLSLLSDKQYKAYRYIIDNFIIVSNDIISKEINSALNKPLKEKYATIKYFMDVISRKMRANTFIVGITLLFVSIVVELFNK